MSELKERIRSELIVEEESVFSHVIPEVKRVLGLDSEGDVVLKVDSSLLTQREVLSLLLIGRWFAHHVELKERGSMSLDEFEQYSVGSSKTVRARLAELVKKGVISKPARGEYQIRYTSVPMIVEQISEKVGFE